MARITNGSVTYTERRRIADYEHKEAIVALSFTIDADETYEAVLGAVMQEARERAQEMVGSFARKPATRAEVLSPAGAKEVAAASMAVEDAKPKKAGRPPSKVKLVAPVEDPLAGMDDPAPAAVEDPLAGMDEDVTVGAPVEITDVDLNTAIKTQAPKCGPTKVRQLITKFNGGEAGKAAIMIPAAMRGQFLQELSAL